MAKFTDPDHSMPEAVYQGSATLDLQATCDDEVLEALERWRSRPKPSEPSDDVFHLDRCRVFTITYDGRAAGYWPDEAGNLIGESLLRDFLFRNGICEIDEPEPRLYAVHYRVIAMDGTEYLLVCPYLTAAGNIGGLVVTCVNLRRRTP